jgi:hypothetical protein
MDCSYLTEKKWTNDDNRVVKHSVFAFRTPVCRNREATPRYMPPAEIQTQSGVKLLKAIQKKIVERRERIFLTKKWQEKPAFL